MLLRPALHLIALLPARVNLIEKTIFILIYLRLIRFSQFDQPIAYDGYVDITVDGQARRIGVKKGSYGRRCGQIDPHRWTILLLLPAV